MIRIIEAENCTTTNERRKTPADDFWRKAVCSKCLGLNEDNIKAG